MTYVCLFPYQPYPSVGFRMAAAVESSNQRYYCHSCQENISPTIPEFTCPTCELGFIEEVHEDEEMAVDDDHDMEQSSNQMRFSSARRRRLEDIDEMSILRPNNRRRTRHTVHRSSPGLHHEHAGHFAALDQILRFFNYADGTVSLAAGSDSFPGGSGPFNLFHIHGNPGDYAWGGRGFDSIITRLLEQMEGSGPPPAEPDKIAALPTVKVTQIDVDLNLECPVCKDAFKVEEDVKRLPCQHSFHEMCITPWLEKHDSCPICRLGLNGTKNNTEN